MEVKVKVDDERINKILKRMCKNFTSDLRTRAIEKLEQDNTIDTGMLIKSSHLGEVSDKGLNHVGTVLSFDAPYAACVEFGTHPGYFPPFVKIHKWVKRKLGMKKKKESTETALKIVQSIHKHGTKPHPFFRPALKQVISEWENK